MRLPLRLAALGCLLSACILWYWPRGHAASAEAVESQGCGLVAEALDSASKLKAGMLRAEIEKEFEPDGGLSARGQGTFTYRRCHYIKIDIQFKVHEDDPNTYPFSSEDQASKISKPYLAYPVSD
jgi:hypothetical protein